MIHTEEKNYTIYNQSCLDVMDSLEENSIDCIVTDPPYEIGFMGKKWDNTGIAFNVETWKKALRVLKLGGYLLAFNHSRTFHRMMVAIEDAGFELRDTIMWLYGSGFPKSHNISKAIDKKMGVESEIIGNGKSGKSSHAFQSEDTTTAGEYEITKATSNEAKQWQGFGTALKPAFEPIVIARKPFKSSVAENILKYGVGAINIDECRIGSDLMKAQISGKTSRAYQSEETTTAGGKGKDSIGRWPANIIHDGSEETISGFPNTKQGGDLTKSYQDNTAIYGKYGDKPIFNSYADEGSTSRYFYTAKASVKDRDEGLSKFEDGIITDGREKPIDNAYNRGESVRKNIHPTVKPTDLMQYLIRLVAPKGATILDPFMGSGSTGKAVMIENTERNANYHFIGVDLEKEYCDIAKARIEWGINFKILEDTHILYDEKGNTHKVIQDKLNLFGEEFL